MTFYSFLFVLHFTGSEEVSLALTKGLYKAKRAKGNVEITGRRPGPSLLVEYLYLADLAALGVDVADKPWVY